MADTSGALSLPAAVVANTPATDPSLGYLLAYLCAVIDADTGAAWRDLERGTAGSPIFGFAHDPGAESFSEFKLPALYLWRDGQPQVMRQTEDWDTAITLVKGLFVLPSASDEQARQRHPFFNAFAASVRRAIAQGRHTAWIVPGDTYYDPDELGSSLAHWCGYERIMLKRVLRTKLRVENYEGGGVSEFDAFEIDIDLTEQTLYNASAHGYPAGPLRGTVAVAATPLVLNSYQFGPVLTSCTPATGPQAGGTAVLLSGTQLAGGGAGGSGFDTPTVTFGGIAASSVTVIDEGTVLAVSPAHAAGAVDIVLTQASGASATLAGAFTFV